jgi:hypothetical protein
MVCLDVDYIRDLKLGVWERLEVARNPNTPPETLTILARDKNSGVRWWVARHNNTPPEILTILARDKDWGVRYQVIHNPNSTREVIQTVRAYEFYKEHPTL